MKRIISIDPGKNGGLAYVDQQWIVCTAAMPATDGDILDLLRSLRVTGIECAVVEEVVGFIPMAGAGAMFSFGKGFGFLLGCLMALGYRVELVRPAKWQKALSLGAKKDHGKEWKSHLKGTAQRLFPHLEVTLKTADALLILHAYESRPPATP
jgi:crossover junction endodeoxyribonuclease RuvC